MPTRSCRPPLASQGIFHRQVVDEITFDSEVVRMQGPNAALLAAAAGKKMGTARVPTSSIGWGG